MVGKSDMRHRAERCIPVQRIAKPVGTDDGNGFLNERIEQVLCHVNALNATATLAGIEHGAVDQCLHGGTQIRIVHHITRVLTAKLQPNAGKSAGSGSLDDLPPIHRTGKIHKTEGFFRDQLGRGLVGQKYILEDLPGNASGVERLRHVLTDQGRL